MTETDHGKPYTDADVETVALALWAQCGEPDRTRPTPTCYEDARAVLDALTADGWRPPGRPTRTQEAPCFNCGKREADHVDGQCPRYLANAGPDWSHEIAFDADGDWAISHPDGCPGQAFGDCDVQRLAAAWFDARGAFAAVPGHRFRCAVNDLRDRFLLGDRIDAADPLATAIEETQEVATELAEERTEHQAALATVLRLRGEVDRATDRADRLAAALTHAMRRLGGEGIPPKTWESWWALLAEHAERVGRV